MGTISPETRLYFLFARPRDIGSYLDMLQAYPNIRFITGASSLITTGKEEDYYPNMYHRIYQENVLHKSTNVTFMNTTGNHE
jgi:hypothetical protein